MELLVVLAIIAILASLSMTAITALLSSNNLNEAASLVQGQLDLARQTALTLNRSVQIRFFLDQNNTAAQPSIDSLQVVVPSPNPGSSNPDEPVQKVIYLPQKIIIAEASADFGIPPGSVALNSLYPTLPSNISQYYVLTFSTSGSITPAPANKALNWIIYLVPQNAYRSQGSPATNLKNYVSFNLNYLTGTYTVTRP
jgi:uncharacterized protein (TIGR02596 family)